MKRIAAFSTQKTQKTSAFLLMNTFAQMTQICLKPKGNSQHLFTKTSQITHSDTLLVNTFSVCCVVGFSKGYYDESVNKEVRVTTKTNTRKEKDMKNIYHSAGGILYCMKK
jgi:hypothetical protein